MKTKRALAVLWGGLIALSASCRDDHPRVVPGGGGSGGEKSGASGASGGGGGQAGEAVAGAAGQEIRATGGGGSGGMPGSELALDFEAIALEGDPKYVTHFAFFPGSSQFLATTRQGRVLHYDLGEDGTQLLGDFEISDLHVQQDCGLISFAFDPNFEDNGFVYFGYCLSTQYSAVVRYVFDPDAYDDIAETGQEIIRAGDAEASRSIHQVGKMGFDEADNLWVTFGEKGQSTNAQDTTTPLGALLRLRPLAGGGYEAPDPPNPEFADGLDTQVIYAYGLRSPWTAFLDSKGRYWLGDVGASGQDSIEEINLTQGPGTNFGWGDSAGPCQENCEGVTDPVRWWARGPTSEFELEDPLVSPAINRVAWVGVEYRETEHDRYQGLMTNKVLYGDMCLGYVRAIEVDEDREVVFDRHVGHMAGASAWQVGPDGFVYAITYARCTHGTDVDLDPGKLMRARLVTE